MKNVIAADYKYILKTKNLSGNQKRVLSSLCLMPTAHPYSAEFMSKYNLTTGGVRSALRALQKHQLVIRDGAGVWRLKNPGMQAWYYAIQTNRPYDEIEALRFGEWGEPSVEE